MKFKFSWFVFPLIPYFAWIRFNMYGKINAAQMKYHKRMIGVTLLFYSLAAFVGAIIYTALVFKNDISGNWYALFFIEWVAGCLTVNLYASKNWKPEEYKVLSHKAIPFKLVPDSNNVARHIRKSVRATVKNSLYVLSVVFSVKLVYSVVAIFNGGSLYLEIFQILKYSFVSSFFWMATKIKYLNANANANHDNMFSRFHGTQFPLGFTNHDGRNEWLRYGWRRPDCEAEDFYPRHIFIGGELGSGMLNMTKYLLSRVNVGRPNRLAVMLLDAESGLNYEKFKGLPGVAVCMGENIRKAIQYLAENVVMMRNQQEDIDAGSAEIVLFTDYEITDALFGVSEEMKGMRDQFRSLVVLGKRNGVHLVCLGSPALNFKQTKKEFQNYFDLLQFHTTATYAVMVKNKTQFVKVRSPHPFQNNFLTMRGDEWLECKAPEIETAQLRRALAEHERMMMKGARDMFEEFQSGLPPVAKWQRQAEAERETPKIKTIIQAGAD